MWDLVRLLFCVAGAVFGADPLCVECHFAWQAQYLGHYFTLYMPHTLHALHSTHYTFGPVLSFIWCGSWNAFFGLDYEGLLFLHGHSIGCTTLLLPWQVHGLCSFFFLPPCPIVFFFQSPDECVWLTCFANHHPR